ncbi:MAG TPA: MoaD/ThiS family protein [Chitinophagaceae bacterium]|nr:MoaD/ThiS family protein [Chitinophagaceae bacterium]
MKIEILLFGQLTDLLKTGSISVEPVDDTNELNRVLQARYPALQRARYVMAVDKQTVTDNVKLSPGSLVALLPPFSGG